MITPVKLKNFCVFQFNLRLCGLFERFFPPSINQHAMQEIETYNLKCEMFFDLQLLTPSLSFPPCLRKLDASGGISQFNLEVTLHRPKMSAHALLKMTRDLLRAMSLALRQKYPRNVIEMKEAMTAFFGCDSVVISCQCKRSKIIFIKVLTEVCSLENIASWNWRKIAVAWSDSVLLTLRSLVCMWKTCQKGG